MISSSGSTTLRLRPSINWARCPALFFTIVSTLILMLCAARVRDGSVAADPLSRYLAQRVGDIGAAVAHLLWRTGCRIDPRLMLDFCVEFGAEQKDVG